MAMNSPPLYISKDGVYGRRTVIRNYGSQCEICNEAPAIDVDTSDEEYQSFACCGPCFMKLWVDRQPPQTDV